MPGGGATFIHLSEQIPLIKESFQDPDEQIGADIIGTVRHTAFLNLNILAHLVG